MFSILNFYSVSLKLKRFGETPTISRKIFCIKRVINISFETLLDFVSCEQK